MAKYQAKGPLTLSDEILHERTRQRLEERYTEEHDDEHIRGEIATAAACYALTSQGGKEGTIQAMLMWPWEMDAFKPTRSERDLIKAGALILAELERIERAKEREEKA